MKKLKQLFIAFLPGIFLIGYNIGTGSVTAMSKAGANHGLDLLWTVLLSCIATGYLLILFSRYTMVTGQTVMEGMRKHIHPAFAMILLIALSAIILNALIGMVGLLGEIMYEWSKLWQENGIGPRYWGGAIAFVLFLLLWKGNTSFFEKFLAVMVGLMAVAFLSVMAKRFPPLSDLAAGMVPKLPPADPSAGSESNALLIVAGMVGTTVSTFTFLVRSALVREAKWDMKKYRHQKWDAVISATMMFVLSAAIMIVAAETLHVKGLKMEKVTEMIPLLEPIAGKAALSVLVVGILAAGISSHLPNLLMIPWLILDYRGEGHNTRKPWCQRLLLGLSLFSCLGVILGVRPIYILLVSQAFITVVLPLTVGSIYFLTSRRKLMGEHTNSWVDHIALTVTLLFALFMSYQAVLGLSKSLSENLG